MLFLLFAVISTISTSITLVGQECKGILKIKAMQTRWRTPFTKWSALINRTLIRRMEQLEARLMPLSEPRRLVIEYVAKDGTVVETKVLDLPGRPIPVPRTMSAGVLR